MAKGETANRLRHFFATVLVAALLVFAIQNTTVVTIQLLFWKVSLSRALLILFVFAMGLLAGLTLANILRSRRHGR